MPDKIKFDDVGSDYEPTDSEGEYSEGEKEVLEKVRRRGREKNEEDEPEDAVLGFDDEDDEEPDFDDIRKFEHDSDIEEGGEEDDLPDRHAWGSKASAFYGTGYTDRDYDTLTAQEEELAQLEEAEALEIQKRLIQGMTTEDFQLDLLIPSDEERGEQTKEDAKSKKQKTRKTDYTYLTTDRDEIVIEGDLSDLSERQQRELFRKDAPEFDGLVNDFSTKLSNCIEVEPVLELIKRHNKLQHPFGQLLARRYELSLLYCNNINFYVLMKSQKKLIRNHPLVKRLLQLKRLVQEVEQKYEKSIKSQVAELLAALEDGIQITLHDGNKRSEQKGTPTERKGRRLKTLDRLEEQQHTESYSDDEDDDGTEDDSEAAESNTKRVKLGVNEDNSEEQAGEESTKERQDYDQGWDENMDDDSPDAIAKRKITYQMAKNKGLTVRKRKEQRNIRVKNKQKYRKALIRRKGAVRAIRTEMKRYSGETSIKAFVKRGIKIK